MNVASGAGENGIDPSDFDSAAFQANPYPLYQRMRHHYPVYHDRLHNMFHVARYRDVASLFRDDTDLGTRPHRYQTDAVLGPTMLSLGGAEHAAKRNLVADALVGRKLDAFTPIVEQTARDLASRFADRGQVNLTEEFTSQLPIRAIMALLGLPAGDLATYVSWYKQFSLGIGSWADAPRLAAIRAMAAFEDYLVPLIAMYRRRPAHNLISRLIDSGLPDGEITTFVGLLLVGGADTTDKAMGNMWLNLLQQPELVGRVSAQPELLDRCFTETMRHSPPLHYQERDAVRDTVVAGVTIPSGYRVRLLIGSANRDESVFADPDAFDPFRPDLYVGKDLRAGFHTDGAGSHLGFGLGRHFCIGYQLARREAVVGSRELLRVMKNPRLAESSPIGIQIRTRDGVIRSVGDLHVDFGN